MNIMSFNIRGCGNIVKKKRLQHHIRTNKIDLCLLQETKVNTIYDSLIKSLWGDKDMDWTSKSSDGLSGGILII